MLYFLLNTWIELLIQDLFSPSRRLNPDHKSNYIYLLAYATHQEQSEHADLKTMIQAIQEASAVCSNNSSPLQLVKSIYELRRFLVYNVIAMGLLQWVSVIYTDSEYSISAYNQNNAKIYMALLQEVSNDSTLLM